MDSTPQKSNASNKRKKWQPDATAEARRLGSTEDDWNLPGGASVTRGGQRRSARVLIPTPRQIFAGAGEDEDSVRGEESSSTVSSLTGDGDSTSSSPKKKRFWKPPATRVIIEVNPVKNLLEKYFSNSCPKCGAALEVTFPSICVASGCCLSCTNEVGCTFVDLVGPVKSNVPSADDASQNIKRNTDSALNVLYVIAFIASGDGGAEASRLLGLLGLPNSTTMQSRSFGNIEREISPVIQDYTKEIIQQNIKLEVSLHYGDRVDSNNNKLYDLWLENKLPVELWPRLDGCADMGWQQKGSGRKRNSNSGHALIFAMLSRNAIALTTCSKHCGFCKTWYTQHTIDEEVPHHNCFINHEGTSGAMEPVAILRMYTRLYNQRVIVARFVADDDSSMKAKLKWSNESYKLNNNTTRAPKIINSNGNLAPRPNHGRIPRHMPEPTFVADPNHRRKTLSNKLWALAKLVKTSPEDQKKEYDAMVNKKLTDAEKKGVPPPEIKPFKVKPWNLTMSKMDARRISKNFAFMARTLQHKTTDAEMLDSGKAVLEHHFDNHCYCGPWCRRKVHLENIANNSNTDDEDNSKFYRDKTKDAKLYKRLSSYIARFITIEALKELAHNMDTCANESFNNTASWVAPKNRVYCGTNSLRNRLSLALGITSLGTMKYYEGLFARMDIEMNDDVRHFLRVKSDGRDRRLQRTKTKEYKIKRRQDEMNRIKKEAKQATIDRAKREGVYEPGIGMTGGYLEEEINDEAIAKAVLAEEQDEKEEADGSGNKKPAATTTTATTTRKGIGSCRCGSTEHQRTSSRMCPLNPKNQSAGEATEAPGATVDLTNEVEQMANEMDALDSLALHTKAEDYDSDDGDGDSDFYSAASEFSD